MLISGATISELLLEACKSLICLRVSSISNSHIWQSRQIVGMTSFIALLQRWYIRLDMSPSISVVVSTVWFVESIIPVTVLLVPATLLDIAPAVFNMLFKSSSKEVDFNWSYDDAFNELFPDLKLYIHPVLGLTAALLDVWNNLISEI